MLHRRWNGPALALVALLPIPGVVLATEALAPGPPAVAARGAALESDFLKRFKEHLAANATAEMEKLVKEQEDEAAVAIVAVAEEIGVAPSEELEKLHGSLRLIWKRVHSGEFAEKVYRFFSTINASTKANLEQLKKPYDKGVREFENNQEKKDPQNFDFIEATMDELPDYFDQEGDLYHGSMAAWYCARSVDDVLRSQGAELHKAWKYYAKVVELREKLELKDSIFDEAVKRKGVLASKGHDKKPGPAAPTPEPGGDGPGVPPPSAKVDATPVKVPLTFELVASVDAFQRPTYCVDEITEIWNGIPLQKSGGDKGAFVQMTGSPTFVRTGAADVKLDLDGDGKGDQKIPLTGKLEPIKVMLGKGDDARPWGFLVVLNGDKASYQGIQVNMSGSDEQTTLMTLGAASVVGNVNGTQLRIIDETFDAVYGTTPQTYGFAGISDDGDPAKRRTYQPDFDTLVVGASKRARPYSEFVDLDGKWYRISVAGNGKELAATPAAVETGMVKLEFKGAVPPSTLILKGKDTLEKSWFDITEGGAKGIQVPVGTYELAYGELRKGKKKQLQKCAILPGKTPPTWTVRRGETTVVELGAPFDFDLATKKDGDKLTIVGRSVRVVGKAGERYERTWNCVAFPEAGFRKKGTKAKAGKYEKMPKAGDNDVIGKLGWDAPWSPLDLVFDVKGHGEVEVQLLLKQHDFFGKVESSWKE